MDEFDAIASRLIPSRLNILNQIDEYTLYRYYLEQDFTPGIPIYSPIRSDDTVRSFNIFPASKGKGWDEFEFTWKDHGRGLVGNIFTMIKLMYGYNSYTEVYARINEDFQLDLNLPKVSGEKIKLYSCPELVQTKIRIKPIPWTKKGIAFWNQFNIDEELLKFYDITQISYYWSNPTQAVPTAVLDPTFAYRIGGYYQIYSPFMPKDKKFRNDLPENFFFGYLQLPPKVDLLIIDKSAKDVVFNRRLGYWAVAGKSETTLIPPHKMFELKSRANKVLLMLDPDEAGIMQTEKYLQLYPWLEPKFLSDTKDKTDLCLKVGFEESAKIIQNLITA